MLDFLLSFLGMFCPIQYEMNGRDISWSYSLFSVFADLFVIAFIVFVINSNHEETKHNKGIRNGEIYDKEFKPEYTQQGIVPIPFERHYDAEYIVYIKNNECSNYWNVDEETYNNLKTGDIFDYNKYLKGDVLQETLKNNEIQIQTNIEQNNESKIQTNIKCELTINNVVEICLKTGKFSEDIIRAYKEGHIQIFENKDKLYEDVYGKINISEIKDLVLTNISEDLTIEDYLLEKNDRIVILDNGLALYI